MERTNHVELCGSDNEFTELASNLSRAVERASTITKSLSEV